MSEVKVFEVRDHATFLPMMAVRIAAESNEENFLFARAGFGTFDTQQRGHVLFFGLDGGRSEMTCDPQDWRGARTRRVAHEYIHAHWYELPSGSVIDVEFILGETSEPKVSER